VAISYGLIARAEHRPGPVRPAGILPAVLQAAWQRSKTPLGAHTWKSVFLHNTGVGRRRLTNQRLMRDSFGSLLIDKIGRGNVLRRYAYRLKQRNLVRRSPRGLSAGDHFADLRYGLACRDDVAGFF
jgi:hypothetical protein